MSEKSMNVIKIFEVNQEIGGDWYRSIFKIYENKTYMEMSCYPDPENDMHEVVTFGDRELVRKGTFGGKDFYKNVKSFISHCKDSVEKRDVDLVEMRDGIRNCFSEVFREGEPVEFYMPASS